MFDLPLTVGVFALVAGLFIALSVLFILGRPQEPTPMPLAAPEPEALADRLVFLFSGDRLARASPGALVFAGLPVAGGLAWPSLAERLNASLPGAAERLRALREGGRAFRLAGPGGRVLSGLREGGLLRLELEQAPPGSEPETETLQQIADLSPMLVWKQGADGALIWHNRAYLDLCRKCGHDRAGPRPLLEGHAPGKSPVRVALPLIGADTPKWFELHSQDAGKGESLHFALPADPVVRAEGALRNFVQTLTMTFAHLPIGLAIFDRNRQLALFNPALAEMTGLDPAWLTARPGLGAFLDKMRESRHLPEPRDYKSWRHRLAELEKAAEDGTYMEHWPLPDGQTYRVTGRPHPEGAVAFLFEDITATLEMQRQQRADRDIGQSVLDTLPEALAVFSASGDLIRSNDAFADLWGADPREMLTPPDLAAVLAQWQRACLPSRAWNRLAAFAAGRRARQPWHCRIETRDGRLLRLRVAPLAGGAMLCAFRQERRRAVAPEQAVALSG